MAITFDRGQEIILSDLKDTLSPRRVTSVYKSTDSNARDDVLKMIELYSRWQERDLDCKQLGDLIWYFDPNPTHISYLLTNQGRQKQLRHVAEKYESVGPNQLEKTWDRVKDIEQMIEILEQGQTLPPLIVIEGARYENSPASSFIDGVHRGLSEMVYALRFPHKPLTFPAYVGQKASLGNRLLKKIGK